MRGGERIRKKGRREREREGGRRNDDNIGKQRNIMQVPVMEMHEEETGVILMKKQ